jgi:hypothetical protein
MLFLPASPTAHIQLKLLPAYQSIFYSNLFFISNIIKKEGYFKAFLALPCPVNLTLFSRVSNKLDAVLLKIKKSKIFAIIRGYMNTFQISVRGTKY